MDPHSIIWTQDRRRFMANKYVTFGEIMLRLKSPEHERFFQSPLLEATFGGGKYCLYTGFFIPLGMKSKHDSWTKI